MDSETPWTATDISAGVRAGTLSARSAAADALSRIVVRDPVIGAFQVVREQRALAEANAVDARSDLAQLPLAGVPVAIKDNIPVEGEPMTVGSQAGDHSPQARDHEVVSRLRAAGAVVVGITRVPELCVFGASDSVWGVTHNPWNLSLTPGGSSGGSAAAIAAGMVPVAHGNDGFGSVRIPAACCGLVGIKPGLGVVPSEVGVNAWFSMSENGALATTAADAALLLSVMAGNPDLATVVEPDRVRIAVSSKSPVQGVTVDREWLRATFETAGALMRAGHDVERREISYPQATAVGGLALWFAGAATDAEAMDISQLEPRVRRHVALGRRVIDAPGIGNPLTNTQWRDAWRQRAGEFLTEFDLLMTPMLARSPIEAKRWGDGSWLATMAANVRYAPFAAPWNIAGFPAISVPTGVHTVSGTPLGVQLVAAPGRESLLLGVAAQIERLRPWQSVAPDYL